MLRVQVRSPRPPRNHVEAYPGLDVREARKHIARGRDEVLWRDQRGTVWGVGQASFDGGLLTLHSHFRPILGGSMREEVDQFACQIVDNDAGGTDVFTACPACARRVRKVIMVDGSWACRSCQRLGYRSSMIGTLPRQSERLSELERRVGDGRPKGMHETTFQALRLELAELKALIGDVRSTSSTTYAEVITAYWQESGPDLRDDRRLGPDRE